MTKMQEFRRLVSRPFGYAARWRMNDAERQVADFVHELSLTAEVLGDASIKTEWERLPHDGGASCNRIVASFRAHFNDDGAEAGCTLILSFDGDKISLGHERFRHDDLDALFEALTRQVTEGLFAGRIDRLASHFDAYERWALHS